MQYKQKLLSAMIMAACSSVSTQSLAALNPEVRLDFNVGVTSSYGKVTAGSYFGMDTNGDSIVKLAERTAVAQNNGLILSTIQDASGSHSGAADGTESPDIDAPWGFFGNTGMHYATAPTNILSDDDAGNATIDFSGWGVTWNGISRIDMSSGAWESYASGVNPNGVAIITCSSTCTPGDTYTLQYSATVPAGDPSGFGGVKYNYYLEGAIPDMPPVATDDTVTVNEDSSGNIIDVLSNDTDGSPNGEEGQTISVTAAETNISAAKGTVSLNSGTITYTPNAGATGTDTFDYTVSDGTSTATGTVNIIINAKPIANDDNYALLPGTSIDINISDIIANDTDEDPASLVPVFDLSSLTGGSIDDSVAGILTFDSVGVADKTTVSLTYTITDDKGLAADAVGTVFITVDSDLPPLCGNKTVEIDRNTDATIDLPSITTLGGSKTINGSSITIPTAPAEGSTSIDTSTAVITYTPAQDSLASVSFTYDLQDSANLSCLSPGNITINVNNVTPTATDLNVTTTTGAGANIDLSASISDDLTTGLSVSTTDPANGALNINGLVVTYTPNDGFSGIDSFTYSVTDADGAISETKTVTINVELEATDIGTIPPTATVTAPGGGTPTGLTVADVGIDKNMSSQCIGGCIDFSMSNLGGSTTGSIVVQLSEAIPANAIYRKLKDGIWRNFESDSNNFVQSAPLSGTNCPGASSTAYTNGLTEGNQCLKVTIEDNGSNDTDATVGTIADPSGVAVAAPIVGYTDGCSMSTTPVNANERADWWLVAGFMGLLGWLRLKRKKA